jgi:hypothetical protein
MKATLLLKIFVDGEKCSTQNFAVFLDLTPQMRTVQLLPLQWEHSVKFKAKNMKK